MRFSLFRLVGAFALAVVAVVLGTTWLRPASDGAAQPECISTLGPSPGIVVTDRGAVQGERAGATYAFKGIPYAAPPVGALRWAPPVEAPCWPDLRSAAAFGAVCPQLDGEAVIGDEDCLTLNVWTPVDSTVSGPLPVMVFIHGGGNARGSSAQPIYDGRRLAEAGVVLVTFNYRLGPLGFLPHPSLLAEHQTGNFGILDQIAALRWVQRNIAAFGGDPARVTIFGESAGAVDTCVLIASPLAAGLFHRAIMESGACLGPVAMRRAEDTGRRFVAASPCADATDIPACLRGLDTAQVLRTLPASVSVVSAGDNQYGPAVDGLVLPAAPIEIIHAGRHTRVPLIVGVNAEETGQAVGRVESVAQYRAAIVALFGPALAERIVAEYPVEAYGSPRAALVAVTSDVRFVCTARQAARVVAGNQLEPVYRYLFTQRLQGQAAVLGAFHGLELVFVFGTLGVQGGFTPSAEERALSEAIIGYWTRFAATGDPNGAGAPEWPRFERASDTHLVLGTPITAGAGIRTAQCDFWDSLVAGTR